MRYTVIFPRHILSYTSKDLLKTHKWYKSTTFIDFDTYEEAEKYLELWKGSCIEQVEDNKKTAIITVRMVDSKLSADELWEKYSKHRPIKLLPGDKFW